MEICFLNLIKILIAINLLLNNLIDIYVYVFYQYTKIVFHSHTICI